MSAEEPMTLDEIQRAGIEALRRELGVVGTVRFLQSLGPCRGDYTAEKHKWLDELDLDTIVAGIEEQRERLLEANADPDHKLRSRPQGK